MKLKKKKKSNYLPLQIWTLKICNPDIYKTLTARGFKLGQLIEDEKLIRENFKKSYFIFFELSPFADLDFENVYS